MNSGGPWIIICCHQNFGKTLHNLDAELARTGGSPKLLSNIPDISSFLVALGDALAEELPLLQADYLTLDAACRVIFRHIAICIGNEAVSEEDPEQPWNVATTRSYEIVFQILTEMKNVNQMPFGTKGPTTALTSRSRSFRIISTQARLAFRTRGELHRKRTQMLARAQRLMEDRYKVQLWEFSARAALGELMLRRPIVLVRQGAVVIANGFL
jgi:hypothetical protein